jgi:Fe-S oxidoreductase
VSACFNTLKNEYPEIGADLKGFHHTQLINQLLREGKIINKRRRKF